MARSRTEIPSTISAKILFEQDRTCCVCREKGKVVQIHHIDGDPKNHQIENLAVLCLEDHNRTELRGGFGRQLTAAVVVEYRDDWVLRVCQRRDRADATAHIAELLVTENAFNNNEDWSPPSEAAIIGHLNALPLVRRAVYASARPRWNSGISFEMREATYEANDTLGQVLTRLASFYPPNHFGRPAAEYFPAYADSRYDWHAASHQPLGRDTGGTMVNEIVAGMVMHDLEALIAQIVEGLHFGYTLLDFDITNWRKAWESASTES